MFENKINTVTLREVLLFCVKTVSACCLWQVILFECMY